MEDDQKKMEDEQTKKWKTTNIFIFLNGKQPSKNGKKEDDLKHN